MSDPHLLDVDVGGLQGETLRRAPTRQHELAGIVVHAVLQTQVGHLRGRSHKLLIPTLKTAPDTPHPSSPSPPAYLDALLELVAGRGRAFPEQLAEDDDLLEEENPPFFGARQDAGVLLRHEEGFLLQ